MVIEYKFISTINLQIMCPFKLIYNMGYIYNWRLYVEMKTKHRFLLAYLFILL
jgi:hypothetical protein